MFKYDQDKVKALTARFLEMVDAEFNDEFAKYAVVGELLGNGTDNMVPWAMDYYNANRMVPTIPSLVKLFNALLGKGKTEIGSCDRYAYACKVGETMILGFENQNVSYFVTLNRVSEREPEGYHVHIRKTKYRIDCDALPFDEIGRAAELHANYEYNRVTEYLSYADGRDQGYVLTLMYKYYNDFYVARDSHFACREAPYIMQELLNYHSMIDIIVKELED